MIIMMEKDGWLDVVNKYNKVWEIRVQCEDSNDQTET